MKYGKCPKCMEYKRLTVIVNKVAFCGECYGEKKPKRKSCGGIRGHDGNGYGYADDMDGASAGWGIIVKQYEENKS